jgi:hypothetical protein
LFIFWPEAIGQGVDQLTSNGKPCVQYTVVEKNQ